MESVGHKDTFFHQGKTHRVCQDYAIHNNDIVIISDGCSSAKHSDVGARLLTHSLLKEADVTWRSVLYRAEETAYMLGLPPEALGATLLTLSEDDDNIMATMIGDGCVVSRKGSSGELEIFNLEFESGAPYYLRYELDNIRTKYLEEFGDKFKINGVPQEKGFFDTYPLGVVELKFPKETYDLVTIFSDGINSFYPNTALAVIPEFLQIKGFAGKFVERRCIKAIQELAKNSIYNLDDFSMGAIKV